MACRRNGSKRRNLQLDGAPTVVVDHMKRDNGRGWLRDRDQCSCGGCVVMVVFGTSGSSAAKQPMRINRYLSLRREVLQVGGR